MARHPWLWPVGLGLLSVAVAYGRQRLDGPWITLAVGPDQVSPTHGPVSVMKCFAGCDPSLLDSVPRSSWYELFFLFYPVLMIVDCIRPSDCCLWASYDHLRGAPAMCPQ